LEFTGDERNFLAARDIDDDLAEPPIAQGLCDVADIRIAEFRKNRAAKVAPLEGLVREARITFNLGMWCKSMGFAVLLVIVVTPSRPFAGESIPDFSEAMPKQEDMFHVFRGVPASVLQKTLYDSGTNKHTVPLRNGDKGWNGVFSSFDEMFYTEPLPISSRDEAEMVAIFAQAKLDPKSKNPFARILVRQAEYAVTRCHSGRGYNLRIYPRYRTILAYGSFGKVGVVHLNSKKFDRLLEILRAYSTADPS
jgi:hypothetical protein